MQRVHRFRAARGFAAVDGNLHRVEGIGAAFATEDVELVRDAALGEHGDGEAASGVPVKAARENGFPVPELDL